MTTDRASRYTRYADIIQYVEEKNRDSVSPLEFFSGEKSRANSHPYPVGFASINSAMVVVKWGEPPEINSLENFDGYIDQPGGKRSTIVFPVERETYL